MKGPSGQKTAKYNAGARRHGLIMVVLGSVMFAVGTQLRDQLPGFGGGQQASQPAPTSSQPAATSGQGASQSASQPAAPSASAPGTPGLTTNLTGSNEYEELVLEYLAEGHRLNLMGDGYATVIHRELGQLGHEESEEIRLTLPANSDLAVHGVCDNDCSDLDIVLFTGGGSLVDEDTTLDDVPLVRVQTGGSAVEYVVRVRMVTCSAEPCYYAFGVFRR